jgi:hypothetical protein
MRQLFPKAGDKVLEFWRCMGRNWDENKDAEMLNSDLKKAEQLFFRIKIAANLDASGLEVDFGRFLNVSPVRQSSGIT